MASRKLREFVEQFRSQFEQIPNEDPRATIGCRDLVAALVLCFCRDRGKSRTLECIRKHVKTALERDISRGAFWERLATKRLRRILTALAGALIEGIAGRLSISSELLKVLGVQAIFLLDSTSSSLPKDARKRFPAPRNNVAPAAVKLHLCFDVLRGAVRWFQVTPATTHDRKGFPPIASLAGKLIIFDLGYWDYLLLAEIQRIGGFFLSRLKANAVVRVLQVVSGLPAKDFEGQTLLDRRLPKKKIGIVELIGEFSLNREPALTARVIGFWNPLARRYHWYVTNLIAPAKLIYPLYRLRWQLELVFKAFKSSLRLSDIPSANENIIHTLVYAALIASMITYPLAHVLALDAKHERRMVPSFQRIACIISHVAAELLAFLTTFTTASLEILSKKLNLLSGDLYDPNYRKRKTTLLRILDLAASC